MTLLLQYSERRETFIQVGAYTGDDDLIEACRRLRAPPLHVRAESRRAAELQPQDRRRADDSGDPEAVSNYNGRAAFNIAVP